MLIINGKETKKILATDRGIQFGDGCFTTAAVSYGKIILLSAHLERLQISCKRLHINFSSWIQLEEEMQQLAYKQRRAVLKVIITRGSGGVGYSPTHCTKSTRIVRISPWPYHYDLWKEKGISLSLSPIRLGCNPHLAGLKHLNRLEQVIIRAYLDRSIHNEALVLDSEERVTECCTANIFWLKDNTVYTPRLDQAGVNGIMRQFCLRMLASSSFQVAEVYAYEESLVKAEEIIVCNALMPVIPVRKYKKTKFSTHRLFSFLAPLCKNPDLV